MRPVACFLLSVLTMTLACAQSDEPAAEVYRDGVYHAEAVRTYEISGKRDGAATNAVALLTLENGDRLRVELHVTYNPTPVLASGHWFAKDDEGDVREESLKFLGGQGATPSVGGRFVLETNGVPRWRVVLPVRPLR